MVSEFFFPLEVFQTLKKFGRNDIKLAYFIYFFIIILFQNYLIVSSYMYSKFSLAKYFCIKLIN